MFVRRMGRRILILRSYRDGRGRVCQARLGHFSHVRGLEQALVGVAKLYPGADLAKLKESALEKLDELGPVRPLEEQRQKVARAARALVTLLAETPEVGPEAPELEILRIRLQRDEGRDSWDLPAQDIHVQDLETQNSRTQEFRGQDLGDQDLARQGPVDWDSGSQDFARRVRCLRSRYSLRRQCFMRSEAQDYLDALERMGDELLKRGRLVEGARVLAEEVRTHPTPVGRLRYGAVLQRMGRLSEAVDQYSRVGPEHPARHYNLAAVAWLQGRPEQAVQDICRGFVRDCDFECTRQGEGSYWDTFGALWPADGKGFFERVGAQMLVRWRLRRSRENGIQLRHLVPSSSMKWFVPKVLGL